MIVVLADDLSGAAEIGGVAWRHGLTAEIQHDLDMTSDVDLIIVNTDSRSLSNHDSVQRIRAIAEQCRDAGLHHLFLKVDSVLRGHVLTDLAAAMTGLGRQRALLAPANPSLGRTIVQGVYRVNDTLLHETQFAHDPDFPAATASVIELLRQRSDDPNVLSVPVTVQASPAALPERGVIVAEATHSAELSTWAETVSLTTLPAGAAEFFAAYLHTNGHRLIDAPSPHHATPVSSQLFICGSASAAAQEFCHQAQADELPLLAMPQALFNKAENADDTLLDDWTKETVQALDKHARAIIAIDQPLVNPLRDPERLTQLLGVAAERILAEVDVEEILAEGGATAAAVVKRFGWSRLRVEEELAPGVVRTRPVGVNGLRLTMKPGSYVWPEQVHSSTARERK